MPGLLPGGGMFNLGICRNEQVASVDGLDSLAPFGLKVPLALGL